MPTRDICVTYLASRRKTAELCAPLSVEDYVVQPTPEVSPPKWHLAHTSWFYEEMILVPFAAEYRRFNDDYRPLFNSYYKSQGPHWIQGNRGQLSRPSVEEIGAYRLHVDRAVTEFLTSEPRLSDAVSALFELGRNHEEQHQELLVMDIKYILAMNPLATRYSPLLLPAAPPIRETWKSFPEGVYEVGDSQTTFAFDNERPRHKQYVYPFAVAANWVTNDEYRTFIDDGGYRRPELWLSIGWDWVSKTGTQSPLYWKKDVSGWHEYTLHGSRPMDPHAPVVHVNYFEADAYARWKDCRLPTEFEYEVFLNAEPKTPAGPRYFHPTDASAPRDQLWAWTASAYLPYPGYRPYRGPAQEYNGKFMCSQMVLRGGCVATPDGHSRDTYRNFYLPEQRWLFSGVRLARDLR